MSTLIFIAVNVVKPALLTLTLTATLAAAIIITKGA
jgi:hypothetical protein